MITIFITTENVFKPIVQLNRARDGEYSEEIRRGVIKKERLKEQVESEKALQLSLDNELKNGDKKTKHIRIKSATLRDKQGASDHTVKKKQNDLEGRLYRANRLG